MHSGRSPGPKGKTTQSAQYGARHRLQKTVAGTIKCLVQGLNSATR